MTFGHHLQRDETLFFVIVIPAPLIYSFLDVFVFIFDTVRKQQANSHAKKGWEQFTDAIIRTISQKKEGVVFLLWGNSAQEKSRYVCFSILVLMVELEPSPPSPSPHFPFIFIVLGFFFLWKLNCALQLNMSRIIPVNILSSFNFCLTCTRCFRALN